MIFVINELCCFSFVLGNYNFYEVITDNLAIKKNFGRILTVYFTHLN